MEGSIRLSAKERKTLLQAYRGARIARRALIVLLLAEGLSYRSIIDAALVSPTMIAAVKRDFSVGGVAQVLGGEPRALVVASWLMVVVRWLLRTTGRSQLSWSELQRINTTNSGIDGPICAWAHRIAQVRVSNYLA